MNKVINKNGQTFESIRQQSTDGGEYWSARDLQRVLEYSRWENFVPIINKAISSCKSAKINYLDHFHRLVKMVTLGSGAERSIEGYNLSCYACYLTVQTGDPSKPVIAAGQTYFAIQTRRQELADEDHFVVNHKMV